MDEDFEREELDDISKGSMVSLYALNFRKTIEVLTSYVINAIGGAAIYGLISVLIRVEGFLESSILGGIRTGILRTLPRKSQSVKNSLITSIFLSVLIIWLFVSMFLLIGKDFIISNSLLDEKHSSVIPIFVIFLIFIFYIPLISTIFKANRDIKISQIIWTVLKPSIFLLAPTISIILFSNDLYTIWLSVTFSSFLLFLFSFYMFISHTNYKVENPFNNKASLKEFFSYSKNTVVSSIFGTIQYKGIFILMTIALTPTNAGLLSLSYLLSEIIRWPLTSVNNIIPPVISNAYHNNNKELLESLYERTTLVIIYTSIPIFSLSLFFHTEILTIFSEEYKNSTIILPIIAAGQLIAVSAGSVGLIIQMVDHQKENMWLQIIITIIFFPIVIYLALNYSLIGLAVGSAGLLIINNILELIILKKLYNISPFSKRHLKIIILGIIFMSIGLIIDNVITNKIFIPYVIISSMIFYKICYDKIFEDNDKYLMKKCYNEINIFKKI